MDALEARVCSMIAKYLPSPPDESGTDASLAALGLNSLNAIRLLLEIEREFGFQLPKELLTAQTFSTVKTLTAAIRSLAER